ncbi:hypothetical protein [Devosia neptuniae]|uniref:hypothetical protein n=1 Tax=Devosia neptuniae TaxID=191302 RepID=UPI0022AEE9DD|nr:hypothetical protein [Devosia neptuniae]MCZ4348076.1 hypothetical protein [Devosia neptuniae]
MKSLIGKVALFNRHTQRYEEAGLFRGISTDNLAHVEGRWRSLFDMRRREAQANGKTMMEVNAEDAHWEWGKKSFEALTNPFVLDVFVLECGGGTQAIMIVRKGGEDCFSRHAEHPRVPIVYVELLATAPWNRPILVADPVYKGAGRVMVGTAVSLSLEEEYGGRIGLHSLPGAEAFYRDAMNMTDLGVDQEGVHKQLRYFELPLSKVATFLSPKH